jgi:hypothetical protein
MQKLIFFLIILIGLPLISKAQSIDLPLGWREVDVNEFKDTIDYQYRRPPLWSLRVYADFDGDGHQDAARYLAKKINQDFALFITTHPNGRAKHKKFRSFLNIGYMSRTGIDLSSPGKYETACSKGYGSCRGIEPDYFSFTNPGIDFFTFESASSVIFWDESVGDFKEIWTSD